MMRWMQPMMLILLLASADGLVADTESASGRTESIAEPVDARPGKKRKQIERLDLNEVDLEQVEQPWDSAPSTPSLVIGQSVNVREIVEPSGEYRYASFGRPDPFQPPAALMDPGANVDATPAPQGTEIKIISPLQRYPIGELKVKGMWQISSGAVRAVILTPKGEGVVVKEGDPLASGKILSIKREQIAVRLYRVRPDGVREYEDVLMKIEAGSEPKNGVIKLNPGQDPVFANPEADNAPMPVAPLGKALNPVKPDFPVADPAAAQAAAPAAAPAPGAPAPAPGAAQGVAPIQMIKPIEKGLDPVVPRAP